MNYNEFTPLLIYFTVDKCSSYRTLMAAVKIPLFCGEDTAKIQR